MSQLTFPLLQDDELLACLEEMEVGLDPSQLQKPTYEVIKPMFEQLVVLLTVVTRLIVTGISACSAR